MYSVQLYSVSGLYNIGSNKSGYMWMALSPARLTPPPQEAARGALAFPGALHCPGRSYTGAGC